jgi:hypothetical protein
MTDTDPHGVYTPHPDDPWGPQHLGPLPESAYPSDATDLDYRPDPRAERRARRRHVNRRILQVLAGVIAVLALLTLIGVLLTPAPTTVKVPEPTASPSPVAVAPAVPTVPPVKVAPKPPVHPETIYVRGEAMSMWPAGDYAVDINSDETCKWMVGRKGKVSSRTGVTVHATDVLIENDCSVYPVGG